ncbi:MAG: SpoIIE family protein phosphatase [Candidatus Riflebacteria bacterium]|nr:SpoIIE family protein phosphatase [Candidatus Riflebacteria bacterium]
MKNSETKICSDITAWLAFVFFMVLLPLIGGWQGWRYVETMRRESRLRQFQVETTNKIEHLQLAVDSGKYACLRINEVFESSSSCEDLKTGIEKLNREMSLELKYLIWDDKGGVYTSNFDHAGLNADWVLAFSTFQSILTGKGGTKSASSTANLRRIYGPQFLPEVFTECYNGRHIQPLYGDSTSDGRLSWVKIRKRKLGLSIFFSRRALEGMPGIDHQIIEVTRNSPMQILTIRDGVLRVPAGLELSEDDKKRICESRQSPFRINGWYVFKGLIHTSIDAVCLLPASVIESSSSTSLWQIFLSGLLLLTIWLVYHSFMVFCRGRNTKLSIRKQLIILFVLSNALSLSILAILGYDYLKEFETSLQAEAFSSGMTYLQSIDEMHVSEMSLQLRRIEKAIAELENSLKSGPPDKQMLVRFLDAQRPAPFRLILVGSHTPFIGSEYGIMKDGEFVDLIREFEGFDKQMKILVDAMGKLGRYYLSMLNRESLEEMVVTQVELIAESLGQLRSIEMFQEFFAATGSFWQWGMGWRYYPAFIQVLNLFGNMSDYVFLYLWEPRALEFAYLTRLYSDLNRNPLGLKIMGVHEDFRYSFPPELLQNEQLLAYSGRLREKTGTEIDFCDWNGQKHLLMGLKCSSLASMRLLGLFPVSSIEQRLREKFWLFCALGMVSMLVSLALSLVVSRSILRPLGELQTGVLALQKQDFAYRLPDLGGDEFGHLAQIFNTTLVDLEELHTASMVQEKLIDNMSEIQQHGSLRFFGQSRALTNFGGDFMAVNPFASRYLGIFIGDVAGSGVASTLIMAFVKACIMQLEDLYSDPGAVLARIDMLLRSCSSETRQRNFMSLQYALLDAETNVVTIASAGHCYPLLLQTDGCKVIDMPSTPLGAGKNLKVARCEVSLKQGEKLVLYTAGLYRNAELGFEELVNLIAGTDEPCPEKFCRSVDKTLEHIRAGRPGNDDQTIVVIAASASQIEQLEG